MLTQTQSWLVLTFLLAFVTTAPLFGGFIAVVFVNAIASLLVFVGIIRLVLISKPAVLEAFPAPDDLELVLNKPKKKRAYWIDRLKVFLTIIVVMHHITAVSVGGGWYVTLGGYKHGLQVPFSSFMILNQSYFMCLFFFLSGYFTPSSYDRKGPQLFLGDELKRLGIPYLVFTFILGPLMVMYIQTVTTNSATAPGFNVTEHIPRGYNKSLVGKPGYHMPTHLPGPYPLRYFPTAGPTWFLLWLIILNASYVFLMQSKGSPADTGVDSGNGRCCCTPVHYNMACPSMPKLIFIGLLIGLFTVPCLIIGTGPLFMPMTFGSLPGDIIFFIGGIVAKRNDWLSDKEDGTRWITSRYATTAKILTVLLAILTIGSVLFVDLTFPGGLGMLKTNPPYDPKTYNVTQVQTPVEDSGIVLVFVGALSLWLGVFLMVVSVSIIDIFKKYCNEKPGTVWTFLGGHTYTVYLTHSFFVVFFTDAWIGILRANDTVPLFPFGWNSPTDLGGDGVIFAGWLFMLFTVIPLVWCISWCVKKTPGMNQIL